MRSRLFLLSVILLAVSSITAISIAQRRTETEKPITGDFKITIRTTVSGQSTQSTTMIKGLRERDETNISSGGFNMMTVNITQCDMRRTIRINDQARKYLVTPMDSDDASREGGGAMGAPAGAGTSTRGGVVTMTMNTVDTGERKEMFGFTARHLKRTTISQSSPDACNPTQMKFETDGWYINLEYGLNCLTVRPPQAGRPGAPGGCRDRYEIKRTGPTNLGYPLVETTTMYGSNGAATFTSTKEVIDLSRQTLDASLFDVPAGYTEARTQQEMYGAPSMADIMAMAQKGQSNAGNESSTSSPAASTTRVRIGVAQLNNKTKSSASTEALRDQLVAALNNEGLDAVALNATTPAEASIEAKAKQCAYVLYTDISTLKSPSAGKKIGGLLGRATGVGSSDAGKAEARLDFRLLPVDSTSPTMQSTASGKEETQDASVSTAIQAEARAVADALPRT